MAASRTADRTAVEELRSCLALTGQPKVLGDAVYQSLSRALKRGQIPTDTSLVEADLARAMEVSRTPVREALRRLEQDGLVVAANGRGYVVADRMADVEHVFLMRARLEGLAAMLAAEQITLPELEILKGLQAEMESLVESSPVDGERLSGLNYQFHDRITTAARSPRLANLINRLHPEYVSHQVVKFYDQEERLQSVSQHQGVLAALWNRDGAEADRLIQIHFEHGKVALLREMRLREQGSRIQTDHPAGRGSNASR